MPDAWSRTADGVHIVVRLTPKADRDAVDGVKVLSDGRAVLAARVRALPDKGAANAALVRLLAETLDIPGSSVRIVAGSAARLKQVRVDGDPRSLDTALAEFLRKS